MAASVWTTPSIVRFDRDLIVLPKALTTPVYGENALAEGTAIDGPAIITTRATTYLVEPGWTYHAAAQGGVWFIRK